MKPDEIRRRIAGSTAAPSSKELSEAARRYLAHAGSHLPHAVALRMCGEIRLGRWRPFVAEEALGPCGFVWNAAVGDGLLKIKGFDAYGAGEGVMRWRLLGVPVMSASGPDVTRSARGRVATEAIWAPAILAAAAWEEDVARWSIDGEEVALHLRIGDDGSVRELWTPRWGNPGGGAWRVETFGAVVEEERSFRGVTVPSRVRAGWWFGTERFAEGEFFRATIEDLNFLGPDGV
jgi:hypothetical protein